jgi:hypothetical protein
VTSAVAVALGVVLAAVPLVNAGSLRPVVGAVAALAPAIVCAALFGLVSVLPWGLGLLAFEYGVVDLARHEPLVVAPFFGAGLLVLAELVYASRELARGAEEGPGRRLAWLVAVAACALAAAFVPVLAVGVGGPSGLAAEVIAVGASVIVLGASAVLARRVRPAGRNPGFH